MAELGENVAIQVSPVVDGMPTQRRPVSCHPDLLDIVPGMVLGDRPATQDRQAELGPDQLYHRLGQLMADRGLAESERRSGSGDGAMVPQGQHGPVVAKLQTHHGIESHDEDAEPVYGSFTSNVDMKSGSPAFGTPEYAKATIASGQLARRYNFPWRSSNATASNAADAQAAYEAQMSLWPVVLGQANYIIHGFGWLEGGLCASYEKFILDAEMVQMMQEFLKPLDTAEAELGLDAISEVGPGGHFFGCSHTMARYETAFYRPMLSDWRNFENWRDSGAVETSDRATKIWKQLLADYAAPPLDPAIDEELEDFVARRVAEGGIPER